MQMDIIVVICGNIETMKIVYQSPATRQIFEIAGMWLVSVDGWGL